MVFFIWKSWLPNALSSLAWLPKESVIFHKYWFPLRVCIVLVFPWLEFCARISKGAFFASTKRATVETFRVVKRSVQTAWHSKFLEKVWISSVDVDTAAFSWGSCMHIEYQRKKKVRNKKQYEQKAACRIQYDWWNVNWVLRHEHAVLSMVNTCSVWPHWRNYRIAFSTVEPFLFLYNELTH